MSRLRTTGGRVSSAVVAQGTAAAASLILQVVVVRTIGDAGFGTYQVLLAALLLITTIQTGMIGDSLNVLDRESPGLRGALMAAQGGALVLGAAAAAGVAAVAGGGLALVAAFSVATVFWLLEDTCRRLFMARLRFWHLVANDVVYLVVALGTLAALAARPGGLDLVDVLLATAAGAAAAFLAARLQLPAEDFRGGQVTRAGVRELVSFGGWRSAQAGIRPLTHLITRTVVLAFAGAAALGQLQAARLLLAPALTALQGFGSFLLPSYRRQVPGQGWTSRRALAQLAAVLGAAGALYTAAVLGASGWLSRLVFSEAVAIDPVALAGWGTTAVAYGLNLPLFMAALVRRESRRVFFIIGIEALVGVPLTVLVLVTLGASWTPFALTAGMLLAGWLLWRTTPGSEGPAPTSPPQQAAPPAAPDRAGTAPAARRATLGGLATLRSGAVAAAALLVQVVAAVTLAAPEFGTVAVVVGLLAAVAAVHRGLVGEALSRFDREDTAVRGSLVTLQLGVTAGAALLGAGVGVVLLRGPEAGAGPVLLGLLLAVRSGEALLRRLLVVGRREDAATAVDAVSVTVTLVALLGWHRVAPLEVSDVLLALLVGSGAGVAAALVQLPAREWRPVRPAVAVLPALLAGTGERVLRFGSVPLTLLLARVLVVVLAGRAALAVLEASRLLLLPALALLSAGRSGRAVPAPAVAAAIGATGVLALLLADVLTPLLTGGDFETDRIALLGWTAAAAALAVALPAAGRRLDGAGARVVAGVHLQASLAALTAVACVLLLDAPRWAPVALAVGALAGAAVLRRVTRPAASSGGGNAEARPGGQAPAPRAPDAAEPGAAEPVGAAGRS